MRPERDEFFMELAEYYGTRGTCLRGKSACILVRENRPIAAGYVSSPSGLEHCLDVGCDIGPDGGCRRTIHAERSLIDTCARFGIATEGTTLYTVSAPCYDCAKSILNAGIKKVIFKTPYRDPLGVELLVKPIKVFQFHEHDHYWHNHHINGSFHEVNSFHNTDIIDDMDTVDRLKSILKDID